MSYSILDTHIAKRKMKLKNYNHHLSFITTSWKSEVIMCVFDNLQKEMSDIFCDQEINYDEYSHIEDLVIEFTNNLTNQK